MLISSLHVRHKLSNKMTGDWPKHLDWLNDYGICNLHLRLIPSEGSFIRHIHTLCCPRIYTFHIILNKNYIYKAQNWSTFDSVTHGSIKHLYPSIFEYCLELVFELFIALPLICYHHSINILKFLWSWAVIFKP